MILIGFEGNCGFLRPPMTSDDFLGITKYRKLNTGKMPVNSRSTKPWKNRKHRTANTKPQTDYRKQSNFVAPGARATLVRRVHRLQRDSLEIRMN